MSVHARIDTHQHIVPPAYSAWLDSKGISAGGLPIPAWSADSAITLMDESEIATGIVSVSTPGVHLGDDTEARNKAREVNEFAAEVVKDRPDRFGFFATVTLPDVDGAIAEAEYALGTLNADGIILLANIRGTYLGDPSFDPLMQALDERGAVVFEHPSTLPAEPVPGIPPYSADFLLDSTRAAINMAHNGVLDRYPNLKIIISHGGGFIPYAAERFASMCSQEGTAEAGLANLRRFYFDTALTASANAMPSLLAFADPTHITFGSDWPYAPAQRSKQFTANLDAYDLPTKTRQAIDRGNAERLFPRLAAAG